MRFMNDSLLLMLMKQLRQCQNIENGENRKCPYPNQVGCYDSRWLRLIIKIPIKS